MYAAPITAATMANEAYGLASTVATAMLAGWIAERTIDTGTTTRGTAPLAGLLGLYVGRALWTWGDWNSGPVVAGFPIVPSIAGAFLVCGFLKLVRLGVAGPRW